MNNILLVVDMQNDFVTGTLKNVYTKEIIPSIKERIELAKKNDDFVFFTKDTHFDNYLQTKEGKFIPVEHCIKNTWGWEIVNELKEYAEYIYEKSAFGCIDLAINLLPFNFDSIEIVGTCTDICVLANAIILKNFFPEKDIIVNERCCSGTTKTNHLKALCIMENIGIIVKEI